MDVLGAEAPPSRDASPTTITLLLPMASLARASATLEAVLSCVACSPATTSSMEAVGSTSMAEGPDAYLTEELVRAVTGWTLGVVGAMAGDSWCDTSRCNIS